MFDIDGLLPWKKRKKKERSHTAKIAKVVNGAGRRTLHVCFQRLEKRMSAFLEEPQPEKKYRPLTRMNRRLNDKGGTALPPSWGQPPVAGSCKVLHSLILRRHSHSDPAFHWPISCSWNVAVPNL